MNPPKLKSSFKLKSDQSIREWFKVPQEELILLDLINERGNWWMQSLLHMMLLRKYQPRPAYPAGLWDCLHYYFPDWRRFLGPRPHYDSKNIATPQLRLVSELMNKARTFWARHPQMARMVVLFANTGAGKTGLDFGLTFMYRDGMPAWNPSCPHDSEGPSIFVKPSLKVKLVFPPVIIVTQLAVLKGDFMKHLQRRHPYMDPQCFQVIDNGEVPQNKGKWLRKKIETIKEEGRGEGVYFLGVTPETLVSELKRHVHNAEHHGPSDEAHDDNEEEDDEKDERQATLFDEAFSNARLIILDEIHRLGIQDAAKKISAWKGQSERMMDSFMDDHRKINKASAIAFLMAQIRERFPSDHLVVGQTATPSVGSIDRKVIANYMALSGCLHLGASGKPNWEEQWKQACTHYFVGKELVPFEAQVVECRMSNLTFSVYQAMLQDRDKVKNSFFQHCVSNSYGAEVMLDVNSKFQTSVLDSISQGEGWKKKLHAERKKETENGLAQRAVQITLEHLDKDSLNKVIVFYSRVAAADMWRRYFVKALNARNPKKTPVVTYQEIGILAGVQVYPDCKYPNEEGRKRFEEAPPDRLDERVILMAAGNSVGQNLGPATMGIMLGAESNAATLIQMMGRFLRPVLNSDENKVKSFIYLVPDRRFLCVDCSLVATLGGLYQQGDSSKGELYGPVRQFAEVLQSYLKSRLSPHEVQTETNLTTKMLDWKSARQEAEKIAMELKKRWNETTSVKPKSPPRSPAAAPSSISPPPPQTILSLMQTNTKSKKRKLSRKKSETSAKKKRLKKVQTKRKSKKSKFIDDEASASDKDSDGDGDEQDRDLEGFIVSSSQEETPSSQTFYQRLNNEQMDTDKGGGGRGLSVVEET